MGEKIIEVWDLSLRLFHWLLVAGFFTSWWSEGRDIRLHVIAGMMVAGLLIYRFIWGVIGGEYARFSSFRPSRSAVAGHMRSLLHFQPEDHLGHTPLGSMMIFALLSCLLLLVISGMLLMGMQMSVGLFAGWVTGVDFATEILIQAVHGWCLNILLVLVGIHLAGVAAESLLQRQNLIKAMITGKKKIREVKP